MREVVFPSHDRAAGHTPVPSRAFPSFVYQRTITPLTNAGTASQDSNDKFIACPCLFTGLARILRYWQQVYK